MLKDNSLSLKGIRTQLIFRIRKTRNKQSKNVTFEKNFSIHILFPIFRIENVVSTPIPQMRNRFTTRNQWFTETIETIRTSGLTLIISTIRFFKTFTAEFGFNRCKESLLNNVESRKRFGSFLG